MKSKTIIIMIFMLLFVSVIFTTGCTTTQPTESYPAPASASYPAISGEDKMLLECNLRIYVDPETGVNYFVMYMNYRAVMCPRYHADGSLYVSEINK